MLRYIALLLAALVGASCAHFTLAGPGPTTRAETVNADTVCQHLRADRRGTFLMPLEVRTDGSRFMERWPCRRPEWVGRDTAIQLPDTLGDEPLLVVEYWAARRYASPVMVLAGRLENRIHRALLAIVEQCGAQPEQSLMLYAGPGLIHTSAYWEKWELPDGSTQYRSWARIPVPAAYFRRTLAGSHFRPELSAGTKACLQRRGYLK